MSRKKVKKETVKRKTSIYDPMGVHDRGLTENQRLGMTRRMKIENIRNPEKNITKEDLEEYKKLLEFYGMYKNIRAGNIANISCVWDFNQSSGTITNSHVYLKLVNNFGITPQFFVCNTFVIERPDEVSWDPTFWYKIKVGSSAFEVGASTVGQQITTGDSSVTIPRYFIDGHVMNYFKLFVDEDLSDMYISQNKRDISVGYDDFMLLPNNSTPIPYLLYPNTALPELMLEVGFDQTEAVPFHKIIINVTVIY